MTLTLTVIDLSSIFWTNWHATKDQEVGGAFDATIHKVYKFVNGDDPVAIAIDSPPYLRKKISADYKAQRDKPSAVATDQLRRVIEQLEDDGLPVLGAAGYEADDIIATIVKQANIGEGEGEFLLHIITSDKDLLQLVDPCIRVTSPLTGEEFGPDEVHAKFGVWPQDMLRLLALMGDISDNVPGVPRVGIVTAAKIINGDGVSDAIQKKLDELEDQIKLSTTLITLMDNAPIDVNRCFGPRVAKVTEVEPEPETEEETADDPDPQDLPPWVCGKCGQTNSGWSKECGRCHAPKGSDGPAEGKNVKTTALAPVQSTQIVKRESSWALALEPRDSTNAWKLAQMLFESRLYTKFANAQSILAVMLRGRALGLDSTTALDAFDIIKGQPAMSAQLMAGLVLKSGKADYFKCTESTEGFAIYKTHRRDDPDPDPTFYTFDAAMAKKAGLDSKDNYRNHPGAMYRARATSGLSRMVYPDVVGGLYTPDELSDGQYMEVDAEVIND